MGFLDKLRKTDPSPANVVDPVCGMTIKLAEAAGNSDHQGHKVYFCSASCKSKFDANPSAYAGKLRR
ncbi:MAG TPA: YHS domain-containing protein [Candidatus Thermoplasmatota archaeon]|nr:YHS domain-containing protein [Candidatus Thermoplasmatota archaeon]